MFERKCAVVVACLGAGGVVPPSPAHCVPCVRARAQEGAKLQLGGGQLHCGVELCMLLVEAYESDQQAPTPEALARVLSLLTAFPRAAPAGGDGGASSSTSGRQQQQQGGEEAQEPPVEEAAKVASAACRWLRR